jgi:lipoprotein-anchoring transpeptidase ErfK/SrfK
MRVGALARLVLALVMSAVGFSAIAKDKGPESHVAGPANPVILNAETVGRHDDSVAGHDPDAGHRAAIAGQSSVSKQSSHTEHGAVAPGAGDVRAEQEAVAAGSGPAAEPQPVADDSETIMDAEVSGPAFDMPTFMGGVPGVSRPQGHKLRKLRARGKPRVAGPIKTQSPPALTARSATAAKAGVAAQLRHTAAPPKSAPATTVVQSKGLPSAAKTAVPPATTARSKPEAKPLEPQTNEAMAAAKAALGSPRPAAAEAPSSDATSPDGAEVLAALPPPPPVATLNIDINLTSQRMVVSEYGMDKYTWSVSTARAGYRTPVGTYKPEWMARKWYSRQYDWAPMPHSIFFHRGVAIHATNAVRALGRTASHGCVRLAPRNAARLFKLVKQHGKSKTKIVVHGAPRHRSGVVASNRSRRYRSRAARRAYAAQPYGYPAPRRRARRTYRRPPRQYVRRGLYSYGF